MRKDYYSYDQSDTHKPFESHSRFDHQGGTININTLDDLKDLTTDYVCYKKSCTYYQAFEMVDRLIDTVESKQRAIDQMRAAGSI